MPFSPQIGSQSLAEQKQSELQPVNTECLSYDIVSTLGGRERERAQREAWIAVVSCIIICRKKPLDLWKLIQDNLLLTKNPNSTEHPGVAHLLYETVTPATLAFSQLIAKKMSDRK